MRITVTGADEKTRFDDLFELVRCGAEIGLLYTYSPEGRHRYPRLNWIIDVLKVIGRCCAVHVCGSRARAELFSGGMSYLLGYVNRIQVNGQLTAKEVRSLCDKFPSHTIITQHTEKNARLLAVDRDNHAVLVDASGGRGIAPEEWHRPVTEKCVGFAGGLGPTSLEDQLPKIAAVAAGDWWIDMEGRVRDQGDWFDAELAKECVRIFSRWKK